MNNKHTPGPWKIHYYSHIDKEQWLSILNGAFDITHNGASNPAVVACSKYSAMSDAENLANARLIAAAPDLLEALKQVLFRLGGGDTTRQHILYSDSLAPGSDDILFVEYLEQAIKKAEGGS